MEVPGFLTLLQSRRASMGEQTDGSTLCTTFPHLVSTRVNTQLQVIHYLNRAILGPLIAPSMSPIHILVWALAVCFQVTNGLSIGGWLGGYGPTSRLEWQNTALGYDVGVRVGLGLLVWAVGFAGNVYHDDELREIRRTAMRDQKKKEAADGGKGKGVDKVYLIPQNGLFRWILYPHYVLEWVEWGGFWLMAGSGCVPARNFLLNEIAAMVPRAYRGRRWYVERFGKEKVGGRKALIPGLL
jgi:3-oxo-5-alpha-steroid 4-dehydrogenase 1